jgi:hypothetical protein
VSHRADELRARRGWRGPRERYDLIKEGLIALVVTALLVVILALVLGSPKVASVTYQSWAQADPVDFVTTEITELAGTSETATYGPPYNDGTGQVQSIGPISPQTWFGVHTPVNAQQDFIIGPLTALATVSPDAKTALATWTGATADQQSSWATAATKATVKVDGTTVTLDGGDTGPIASMSSVLLAAAAGGVLDAGMVDMPGKLYGNDHTKSLLNLADGDYLAAVGAYYHLTGEEWGIMNEIGDWPGQPWLWWYDMWYSVPGPIRSALDYSDLAAIAYAIPLLLLVAFLPFIPGLRRLPRVLRAYRLIWRDYYRTYGTEPRPRP